MAVHGVYIQLAREFGDTRWGPFQGLEVRFGSDRGTNDICIPENLGIAPQHARVLIQSDGSFIVAPVESTAPVFLWRAGQKQPKRLESPTGAAAGDAISLATPEGIRFELQRELPRDVKGAEDPRKKGKPLGAGIQAEIQRVGLASFATTWFGRQVMNTWRFVKSGQMFSPVYIVMGMTMVSGWLFGAGTGAFAGFAWKQKATAEDDLRVCEDNLKQARGAGKGDDVPTLASLTASILNEPLIEQALKDDKELGSAFREALPTVLAMPGSYEWVYKDRTGSYSSLRAALKAEGFDDQMSLILAFVAANDRGDHVWRYIDKDTTARSVCGRGPAGLTYRQAVNLGLPTPARDALLKSRDLPITNEGLRNQAIATAWQMDVSAVSALKLEEAQPGGLAQGEYFCFHEAEVEDPREDVLQVASAMYRVLGPKASGLPPRDSKNGLVARLMKLYGADMYLQAYEGLEFKVNETPSAVLKTIPEADAKGFILEQSALALARSVGVVCQQALDQDDKSPKLVAEPPFFPCLHLIGGLQYELF